MDKPDKDEWKNKLEIFLKRETASLDNFFKKFSLKEEKGNGVLGTISQ